MPDPIETSDEIFATVPRQRVYVAPTLRGPWEEEPFLYCDSLRTTCAPEIDQAQLRYDYGPAIREETTERKVYEPLDLNGQFVKVVIELAALDGGNVVWYGVVQIDDREVAGSQKSQDEPTGRQRIVAFGLLRLLEQTIIASAVVYTPPAGNASETTTMIARGIPFGQWRLGDYSERGNRSEFRDGGADGSYVFSHLPQRGELWNAYSAAEYLLARHAPQDAAGEPLCRWRLDASEEALAWYDLHVETDLRSVKAVLDDLIPRKRGLGYYVDFDESADLATLHVFTFLDQPLSLDRPQRPSAGVTIPANAHQVTLNFERAFDIEPRLVNQVTSQYDRIIVYGQFATSTCTLTFDPTLDQLLPDWSNDELQEYWEAASGDTDYATLDPTLQAQRNQRFRDSARLRNVYRRWQISPSWNQRTRDFDDENATEYFVDPLTSLLPDGRVVTVADYDPTRDPSGQPLWNEGIILEHALPLKDRWQYSGTRIADLTFLEEIGDSEPQELHPLIFVRTTIGATVADNRWEFLDRLSQQAPFETVNRRWSGQARIVEHRPALELELQGVPQHFLDQTSVDGMAAMDAWHDPTKEAGIDYGLDLRATITLRLQHRVQAETTVNTTPVTGRQERLLWISVPDARLDYVVPKTAVDIENGVLTYSDTGGFVRDDRLRLADIARAAAEWYGRPRQTITLRFRRIDEIVQLGWLITDVGADYRLTGVNTPITAVSYDFLAATTEFETAFAELEFA